MVLTNFNRTGVGFGGGCGIGVGLGWGFGNAFGSQYRNSRVTFDGTDYIIRSIVKKEIQKIYPKALERRMLLSLFALDAWRKICTWSFAKIGNKREQMKERNDVTKFLEEHPGGGEVLIESAEKDATKDFEYIGHKKAAKNLLLKYQIGYLQGYKIQDDDNLDTDSFKEPIKAKEMEAFVIKEDPKPNYLLFVEYFLPFLYAAFYLYYRYLTGALQL